MLSEVFSPSKEIRATKMQSVTGCVRNRAGNRRITFKEMKMTIDITFF